MLIPSKNKVIGIGAVLLIDYLIKKPLNASVKINLFNTGIWVDSNTVYYNVLKTVKKHLVHYKK